VLNGAQYSLFFWLLKGSIYEPGPGANTNYLDG
jgi:hypothetical protein